jgi:1,4-dihydroxy-2-naphthoate octaprenyltransferase
MSINVIDDYHDFKKGLDKEAVTTKFSGGSPFIVKGLITEKGALALGMLAFCIAAIIGIYLGIMHPIAIPFIVLGALSILLYAVFFSRVPFLSEPLTAINNACIVIASFLIAGSSLSLLPNLMFTAIPAGLAIGAILIANEVPDREVDKKYGRRSAVVILNSSKRVSYFYLLWQISSCAILLFGVVFGFLNESALIALIAVPLMVVVFLGIKKYSNPNAYEKYMALDVIYAIAFIALLSLSYLI